MSLKKNFNSKMKLKVHNKQQEIKFDLMEEESESIVTSEESQNKLNVILTTPKRAKIDPKTKLQFKQNFK